MWQEEFAGRGTFEGRLLKAKASLELPRKPIFGVTCFGRLYEKEAEPPILQASLHIVVPSLFLRASRTRTAQQSGPAALLCVCALGGPPFRCGETSGTSLLRRRSDVPSRSFFPQKKRRHPNAPRTKAAVCGAMIRGRAKHAEKEPGIGGKACFHSRASGSFSI